MWWWILVMVALAVGSGSGARAQEVPPGEPLPYAVFAGSSARFGRDVRVLGAVGSNDTLTIGRKNRTAGLVASPTIELGRGVEAGPLFCVLVVGGERSCLPVTSPVVSPGSLGVGLVLPGDEDVEVPRRASRAPLAAGAYRNLEIGRGSDLLLVGGDYLFDRVTLGRKASLRCATACRVAIRKTLRIGSRAAVEGLARRLGDADPPRRHRPPLPYRRPSRQAGDAGRTDIYSTGATIYACLAGLPPQAADARLLNDKLTPAAKAWAGEYSSQMLETVDWCMQLNYMERPQSVFALQQRLMDDATLKMDKPSLLSSIKRSLNKEIF